METQIRCYICGISSGSPNFDNVPYTVESHKLKSYGLEVLFGNIENLNYREVDIKKYKNPK